MSGNCPLKVLNERKPSPLNFLLKKLKDSVRARKAPIVQINNVFKPTMDLVVVLKIKFRFALVSSCFIYCITVVSRRGTDYSCRSFRSFEIC